MKNERLAADFASRGHSVFQISRLASFVTKLYRKMHFCVTANVQTLSPNSLLCATAWAFLFFFFDFSTLLSSSPLLLPLSPACTTKARSPLQSSVPCLATRTLDDEIQVQHSPSVGWLSKSETGMWVVGWGASRRKDGWLASAGALMLTAAWTGSRLEIHSWGNGIAAILTAPTTPCSFFTLLLYMFVFPSICSGTGRSVCTPFQEVGYLVTHLAKFHSCVETSFGCWERFMNFAINVIK